MLKKTLLLSVFFATGVLAQWQNTWNSSQIDYNTLSGWVSFDKEGDNWSKRIYTLDSLSFTIMAQGNSTPEYIHNFSAPEILAGLQIYSTGQDLNGNGKMDFYILSYYGTSVYRQAFKIFDMSNGEIIFEKNDPSYYYSYPTIMDINNDGTLECIVSRFDYPSFASYRIEVYNTGASGILSEANPIKFELMQNYPNPFNPSTTISYYIESESFVKLLIYDVQGELVNQLINEVKAPGSYQVDWNGNNLNNMKLPSGVYFYQIEVGQNRQAKKMVLLK
ncbi:MAG TPA: T9SS type A sorting domain-containing protein [Ignavibacteriaceae bacterium]|nr:T9SS type A sorting domain-containing protein [Lutibacter sp.]HMN24387.1 T9SS type A sorting domain-containing protein [Ignavibacteriaceae bacterium]HRP92255.1 T9SS type A sorting domain-containing protein [Ignavibacteriaceae bacterium]